MLGTSVNVKALIAVLLYYLPLEGLIVGYSIGQRAYMGEMPPPQVIFFAVLAILYPVFTILYLKGARWGFIATITLAILAIVVQTPLMLLWVSRMSGWWVITWILLYILPALIILLCYRAYREVE